MDETVYCCTGTCHSVVSAEDYENGLVQCGTKGCTCEGEEFEERMRCSQCREVYKKGEAHSH